MLIFIWYHPQSKYGQSPEARPFIGFWWVWGRCRGTGGQVSGLSQCQETRSQDISPHFVWVLLSSQCSESVPHARGRNVLCWSHSQVSPPIKRGDSVLLKKIWTYLAGEFSFQIWYSRAHFERLSDLSPNVCRRWLISYFLEKQTVRVVNFTLSYLWICFVTQFWLLSKWVLSRISDFTTRRCRWLLIGAMAILGGEWKG